MGVKCIFNLESLQFIVGLSRHHPMVSQGTSGLLHHNNHSAHGQFRILLFFTHICCLGFLVIIFNGCTTLQELSTPSLLSRPFLMNTELGPVSPARLRWAAPSDSFSRLLNDFLQVDSHGQWAPLFMAPGGRCHNASLKGYINLCCHQLCMNVPISKQLG